GSPARRPWPPCRSRLRSRSRTASRPTRASPPVPPPRSTSRSTARSTSGRACARCARPALARRSRLEAAVRLRYPSRSLPFETFIGWRYLFRRRHSRAVRYAFAQALVTTIVIGGLFWRATGGGAGQSGQAPVALVIAVMLSTLDAIVTTLLLFFSVFT